MSGYTASPWDAGGSGGLKEDANKRVVSPMGRCTCDSARRLLGWPQSLSVNAKQVCRQSTIFGRVLIL